MRKNVPPLNSLLAFEAAARLNSFKLAAKELHQTPAAIAYQIKKLEDSFNLQLFDRLHKGVKLNLIGQSYYRSVSTFLTSLEKQTQSLKHSHTAANLKILTLHAIAEKWLMPRLGDFKSQYPELNIEISASDKLTNASSDQLVIGFKLSESKDAQTDILMDEEIFPVCTTDFVLTHKPQTDKLSELEWLVDPHWKKDWELWIKKNNLNTNVEKSRTLKFSLYSMVIDAAKKSMGITMGHKRLIENELSAGNLQKTFDQTHSVKGFYYLKTQHLKKNQSVIPLFINWLHKQI